MDFPDEREVPAPLPHELLLRLAVARLKAGYKPGWLYHRCQEQGLLEVLRRYQALGHLKVLEEGASESSRPARLSVELVPESCWFSNVRTAVTQAQWDSLRRRTARRASHRCEVCGGRGHLWPVECHERWEYDDARHIQRLRGLIALCPSCHEVKHIGLAGIRGKSVEATAHLAIVNGWSYDAAEAHVARAFEVWEERSAWDWELDLSWLEEQGIRCGAENAEEVGSAAKGAIGETAAVPEHTPNSVPAPRKRILARLAAAIVRLFRSPSSRDARQSSSKAG